MYVLLFIREYDFAILRVEEIYEEKYVVRLVSIDKKFENRFQYTNKYVSFIWDIDRYVCYKKYLLNILHIQSNLVLTPFISFLVFALSIQKFLYPFTHEQ